MIIFPEPDSAQIIKPKVVNRHFIGNNYGLALNAWNILHHNCGYICDSWIYRQGSMDNRKVAYYHLYYPRDNFPDHRKTTVLTFFFLKKAMMKGILTKQ
jgi:hypothetical protein